MKPTYLFKFLLFTLFLLFTSCSYLKWEINLTGKYQDEDNSEDESGRLEGYEYRRKVTIDSTLVMCPDSLIDFPLLFTFSSTDLLNIGSGGLVESVNGYDIVFTAADGLTPLAFEIESYDIMSGKITAWIKLPSLPGTTDSSFYIYYGNSAITTSQESTGATWSNSYKAVWHLNDSTGGVGAIKDSTPAGYDGSDSGSPLLKQTGKISGAVRFDGVDDCILLGTTPIFDNSSPFTLSGWLRLDSAPGASYDYTIWARRQTPEYDSFVFSIGDYSPAGNTQVKAAYSNSIAPLSWTDKLSTDSLALSSWTYVTVTFDGTALKFYINGILSGSTSFTAAPYGNTYYQAIGRSGSVYSMYFHGMIDELRISNTGRHSTWIMTEYNNQVNPAAFYTVSPAD